MSSLNDSYLNLITSQHRGKKKYMETASAVLKYTDDVFSVGVYMDDEFDLDTAEGKQEDALGILIGADRILPYIPALGNPSTLNDEDYRVLLKSKIAKNMWRGRIESIEDIWRVLFSRRIKIIDHQDMTIDVVIDDGFSPVIQEAIWRGVIVPKPQSVQMNYRFQKKAEAKIYSCAPVSVGKKYIIHQRHAGGSSIHAPVESVAVNSVFKAYTVHQEHARGAIFTDRKNFSVNTVLKTIQIYQEGAFA